MSPKRVIGISHFGWNGGSEWKVESEGVIRLLLYEAFSNEKPKTSYKISIFVKLSISVELRLSAVTP